MILTFSVLEGAILLFFKKLMLRGKIDLKFLKQNDEGKAILTFHRCPRMHLAQSTLAVNNRFPRNDRFEIFG